jgi:hypothetical protein
VEVFIGFILFNARQFVLKTPGKSKGFHQNNAAERRLAGGGSLG